MTLEEEAKKEIADVFSDALLLAMLPSTAISLVDVKKLMVLAWARGYAVAKERRD